MPERRRISPIFPDLLLVVFYLALALVKSQHFLVHGRLWAEEGRVFFAALHGKSFLDALIFVNPIQDQYFLGLNLSVWIATRIPLEYAPLVTTYFAMIFTTILVLLLIAYREIFHLTRWMLVLIIGAMMTLPQSTEVWANVNNLHWVLQILIALILVLPPAKGTRRWMILGLLLFCGLNGFSIVFLLPLFVLKAYWARDKEDRYRALIAAGTALLQMMLVFSAPTMRSVGISPASGFFAVVNQQMIGPLLGSRILGGNVADAIATLYRDEIAQPRVGGLPFLVITALVTIWIYLIIFIKGDSSVRYFLLASILLVTGNVIGAVPPKDLLVSASFGGRYFYAANMLFFIAVAATRSRPPVLTLYLVTVFITGLLINGTAPLAGRDWREAVRQADALHWNRVNIWPAGWKMENPRPENDYKLIYGEFASTEEAQALCEANCLLVVVFSAGTITIIEDGEIVQDGVADVLDYRFGVFDIQAESKFPYISVNDFPLSEGEDVFNLLLIDSAAKQITIQDLLTAES